MPDRLFTLAQLCARWQCSREYLRKLRESGKLPVVKITPGIVRVMPDTIAALEQADRTLRPHAPTGGN